MGFAHFQKSETGVYCIIILKMEWVRVIYILSPFTTRPLYTCPIYSINNLSSDE